VAKDFFKDLGDARKHKKQMHLVTAMSLRQAGIFKMAGRDVYEDLETGDFWKMSDDKKHVMRLFKEDDKGISDKKASIEIKADTKEYQDSAEFTKDLDNIETIIQQPRWADWMKTTDEHYDTKCQIANDALVASFKKLQEEIDRAR
jgi:hypothetical protein